MDTPPRGQESQPGQEPPETQPSPEVGLNPVEALPHRLGYVDNPDLHAKIIDSLATGDPGLVRQGWVEYIDYAEPQLSQPDGERVERVRLGLTIAQALIHQAAGDTVGYLAKLMDAESENIDRWPDIQEVVKAELDDYVGTARLWQAKGLRLMADNVPEAITSYEAALTGYQEVAASLPPDDPFHETLNLRISECRAALEELER